MADILYIGRSPLVEAAAALLRERGHACVIVSARDALPRVRRPNCVAVVICWTSGRAGPAIAQAAKERGIPVIVVTTRLALAFRRFGPLADIYLEQPASAEEITTLAIELAAIRERVQYSPTLAASTAA